ncbi:MAG: NAD(P)/FAD-dependent oxidoreductase [Bdellovibrionales bacterium]|nr:NAD(P)/FAD-dependent oxidoreductase [Bdellovibrionales bacterium]
MSETKAIAIVGGGAAGFFAAIRYAQLMQQSNHQFQVHLFEGSGRFLQKVRISGGGRCNVTHHDYNIRSFCSRYPRGQKEVLSPMHQFQAQDLVQWFEKRGVALKVEEDGRMFPVTDSSETIIACLEKEALALGCKLHKNFFIESIVKKTFGFALNSRSGETFEADKVLLATGSQPVGYNIAKALGHAVTPLAPSLFSFVIASPLLQELQGVSFPKASLLLEVGEKKKFREENPILITHWGLSGPGILKLSAWAAREMKQSQYRATLTVNWVGQAFGHVVDELSQFRQNHPTAKLSNRALLGLTKRFWERVLMVAQISQDQLFADLSNLQIQKIATCLTGCVFDVKGKNRFKDEFVECGGVDLKEIDMKTMQSKIVPGLFFAGEIMDVDGITGGFNLQHAWTSGYVAGSNMAL